MTIKLDREQMCYGSAVGCRRLIENLERGYKDKVGQPSWSSHIEGALGEVAACVALGVDFSVVGQSRWKQADIPPDWDVRTSRFPEFVRVKPSDPKDRRIICVQGFGGEYDVVGWCKAAEAQEQKFWRQNRYPGFYYPVNLLYQFTLKED